MPFHIEISSSLNNARAFNLGEDELLTTILEPWVIGLSFEFGGVEWQPRESRLTILEGRDVDSPGLASGLGWAGALRAAEDVTRPMLEVAEERAPEQSAIVVEAASLEAALNGLRAGRPQRPVEWREAVEMINRRESEITAVVLVVRRPESQAG